MTNVQTILSLLRVTATGGFQYWFEWSANSIFANIITGLTQPIFNQRQVRTKFEAKANQKKAYLQFEQSLTAGKEVSDALAQYNNETYKITQKSRCTKKKQLIIAKSYWHMVWLIIWSIDF
jgi:outer membrane protein TolC